MTSQGTAHGRFQRAIHRRHVQAAEMAAREMGGLSLADALALALLIAESDPERWPRAAARWHARFVQEAGASGWTKRPWRFQPFALCQARTARSPLRPCAGSPGATASTRS
jgi:hypothetical protein